MKNLTDASRANQSGKSLEERLEQFLIEYDIPHKRQQGGNKQQIDFIIPMKDNIIYADCTNQNGVGSVEEKLPHKTWKYFKQYGYKEVFIIRGEWSIGRSVIEHLKDDEQVYGYKTHIMTIEEFQSYITGMEITNTLEDFMV